MSSRTCSYGSSGTRLREPTRLLVSRNRKMPTLSAAHLKRIACVTMLIDHIAVTFVPAGVIHTVMRAIGRVAFPLFALGVAEGAEHTHDWRRYLMRLLVLAIVSEVPYDLLFGSGWFDPTRQNVVWTLLLGLLAIEAAKAMPSRVEDPSQVIVADVACLLALCGIAFAIASDYGAVGVGLVFVLWLLRRWRLARAAAPCVALCQNLPGVALSAVPIALYGGERGEIALPWAYYAFYPAHILALFAIKCLIGG